MRCKRRRRRRRRRSTSMSNVPSFSSRQASPFVIVGLAKFFLPLFILRFCFWSACADEREFQQNSIDRSIVLSAHLTHSRIEYMASHTHTQEYNRQFHFCCCCALHMHNSTCSRAFFTQLSHTAVCMAIKMYDEGQLVRWNEVCFVFFSSFLFVGRVEYVVRRLCVVFYRRIYNFILNFVRSFSCSWFLSLPNNPFVRWFAHREFRLLRLFRFKKFSSFSFTCKSPVHFKIQGDAPVYLYQLVHMWEGEIWSGWYAVLIRYFRSCSWKISISCFIGLLPWYNPFFLLCVTEWYALFSSPVHLFRNMWLSLPLSFDRRLIAKYTLNVLKNDLS